MNTSEKEPLITALQIQNRLDFLNLISDKMVAGRILARIPKTILEIVQRAKKNDWLPVSYNVEITDCIASEIGDEGVYKLSFESFTKFLNSSIVSPFFRAAMSLVKVKPTTVLKLTPIFWKSIYRNCGEVSIVELGPTRIRIMYTNLPPFVAKNRNYLMALAGGIHAVNAFSGVNGLVILEKYSAETMQASFILSWTSNLMKK